MMGDVSGFTARSIQIAFLAIVAGIWYELSRTGGVSPLFLPPIDLVWNASVRLVQTGQFWSAVRVTLLTIAQAWLIAIVLGILVAYAVTRSRFVTDMVEPVISGVFSVPLTLLFPLFLLLFRIGP